MGEEPGKCGDPVEDVLRWILLVWDEIASPYPGMETPAEKRVTGSKLNSKQATKKYIPVPYIGRKFFLQPNIFCFRKIKKICWWQFKANFI
jgi:hypothetical protein